MFFCSKVMNFNVKNATAFLTFKELERFKFLKHAFSTRLGGVSEGYFKSMNLGRKTNDLAENVEKNYDSFCGSLDIKKSDMIFSNQIHSDKIKIASYEIDDEDGFDGLITNKKGIVIATSHADCSPVYIVDPIKKAIGLAHAGWRGTIKNIAGKMILKMNEVFGCNPSDLVCGIGPGICKSCFEIDKEIADKFKEFPFGNLVFSKKIKKFNISISEANKQNLIIQGVKENNIFVSEICNKCCNYILFSKRASKGKGYGLNIAVMSLVDPA
ncbi:MAG: peptidoglycan editing factor PgeF [Oscillospiraceae bacterium]|nr:peptidoglycan editing factor PgeF [Oscillospiraceae bacterium]